MSFFDRLLRVLKEVQEVPAFLSFCECNDVDCLVFLPLDEEDYLNIRARYPGAAVVLPGHEDDVDNVLERHETYLIVQQIGTP